MPKICPKERQEAKVIYEWSQFHPIVKHFLVPIPNGGSRNKVEAFRMKESGQVRAGVSDYFLAYPANGYAGLWVELKRLDKAISRPTPDQLEWIERMRSVGYKGEIAYGSQEAIQIITAYLSL